MRNQRIWNATMAVCRLSVVSTALAACGDPEDHDLATLIQTESSAHALSPHPLAWLDRRRGQPSIPAPPKGVGFADHAPVADETNTPPYIDYSYTNQRGDARYATLETNAGVRVLSGFLSFWKPSTLLVDAGVTAPAHGGFPAITPSTWTGIPGDATDGTVLDSRILTANIQYVIDVTARRTSAEELAAYLDDRRGKGYSVSDGMGPLTVAWRSAAQQVTTILDIPADATTVKYDDKGNNTGIGGAANPAFGTVVDFVNGIGEHGSTEPAKRFFKYARPWRWSSNVKVVPALEPAKSTTPATDGGFISGHGAEATRDAIAFGYVIPERFQEMLCRAMELGDNRILSGMHSPLDVIGGRIQAQAVATASLATGANRLRKAAAYKQAHDTLMTAVGAHTAEAFHAFAHSLPVSADRFADHAANKAAYLFRLTYGFDPLGDTTLPAVVPKGAEVLLETRQPYLDPEQRRVVLKTTALPSGYPMLDDAEGWGRMNLFAAADGFGRFDGDVRVTMDASMGGFHAFDRWQNDIAGPGKLTKEGTGTLELTGTNCYTGGTHILAGTLQAASNSALGKGDVYLGGGNLVANSEVTLEGDFTQLPNTRLELSAKRGVAASLEVHGRVTLAGGVLHVKFAQGYSPSPWELLHVIQAGQVRGKFTKIIVDGYQAIPFYGPWGLVLSIFKNS